MSSRPASVKILSQLKPPVTPLLRTFEPVKMLFCLWQDFFVWRMWIHSSVAQHAFENLTWRSPSISLEDSGTMLVPLLLQKQARVLVSLRALQYMTKRKPWANASVSLYVYFYGTKTPMPLFKYSKTFTKISNTNSLKGWRVLSVFFQRPENANGINLWLQYNDSETCFCKIYHTICHVPQNRVDTCSPSAQLQHICWIHSRLIERLLIKREWKDGRKPVISIYTHIYISIWKLIICRKRILWNCHRSGNGYDSIARSLNLIKVLRKRKALFNAASPCASSIAATSCSFLLNCFIKSFYWSGLFRSMAHATIESIKTVDEPQGPTGDS